MRRAEVLVLGGGIIGCALAEELARRGRRVILVERGRVGAEASSAAAGILAAQMDIAHPGPFFDLCQAARRMYPGWVRRLERRSGRRVGFHVDGILYLASTVAEEQRMARRAEWQRRRGLPVERWSPREVRRREPAIDGRIRCGFWFPAEAQVDNPRLMQALAQAARAAGGRLLEQTAVTRLLTRAGRVRGVDTSRGRFEAPIVVECRGSWSGLAVAGPVRLPVEPLRGQILAFTGPQRFVRRVVMSERAYVVQRRDGRLLVGSTIEHAGFDKALTLEGMHAILCGIRSMCSAMDRCRFIEAWAGFRPSTVDGLPILGATSIEGLFAATGHYRHGILLAPITAKLLSELILNHHTSLDLSPFSSRRFNT